MFFEIACNNTGLVEGRKPMASEAEARTLGAKLAEQRKESFQLWDSKSLICVISPKSYCALA